MKRIVCILMSAVIAVAACANEASGPARPNIVVVVADDMGWRDTGYTAIPT